jgi:electron transport complex protein RnfB
MLDRDPPVLDTARGQPGPQQVAVIDERACIGCTLCIDACPVDAIIGAPKRMHGVLASLCSGCGLCVEPCPVDCIDLVPVERQWTRADASAARDRHQARARRLAKPPRARVDAIAARKRSDEIAAALTRARARRGVRAR